MKTESSKEPEEAAHRPPPPMRVIRKGWWKIDEREIDIGLD